MNTRYCDSVTDTPSLQPEKFDAAWVRRFALNFERKISKNSELRAKFESDPQKYDGIAIETLSVLG